MKDKKRSRQSWGRTTKLEYLQYQVQKPTIKKTILYRDIMLYYQQFHSLVYVQEKKKSTYYQKKKSHIKLLIAALLIGTKVYIIQYLSPIEEKHLWCIHKMECYAAVERSKLQLHKTILMNLTNITLSLRNKAKRIRNGFYFGTFHSP